MGEGQSDGEDYHRRMPSVRQIRRRIRSVENTAKITKAMSMIAASKMRRAQEAAISGRPYADLMRSLLADLPPSPRTMSSSMVCSPSGRSRTSRSSTSRRTGV